MKILAVLAIMVAGILGVYAQNESPIPNISQHLKEYFNHYPKDKIFIMTDKQCYKPGETIWFSAKLLNTQIAAQPDKEIKVRLYNNKGEQITGDKFLLINGSTPGDLQIPDQLPGGQYFLIAYTSTLIDPEEVFCTMLIIDPAYSNQWVASITIKDSISIAGQNNELSIKLHNLAGDIQKNTSLRYQVMNGKEITSGKLKTDDTGSAILPFTLPAQTNGEPFICELTDNKEEWKKRIFLPSNLDPVVISFYPEGGSIVAGMPTKIGFTAYNKWGIGVNVEGMIVNQEDKQVRMVKTFTKGLGLFSVENDGTQKLKLVLSGKSGQHQTFDLPAPKASGLAFSVVKTDLDFITANLVFSDKQKHSIALTVTDGSNLYWAADMEINGLGRIKIPANDLPQGIHQLSVLTAEGDLLASRMVFVDKKQLLKVEVQPEKSTLKQGESMKLKIRMTDENNQPVSGSASISISDSFRKNDTAPQIAEILLFGAELETPFSLISDVFKEQMVNTALMDVFLISNRFRDFNWQKIIRFKPEIVSDDSSESKGISGTVTDKNGNKINKAKVSLVNNMNMQLLTTTTNQDGQFSFPNMSMENKNDFSAKATDPGGKRELKIDFNKNFEDRMADYIVAISKKSMNLSYGLMAESNYFKNNPDLFYRTPKLSKPSTAAMDNQKMLLSSSTNLLDVIKTIKPFNLVNGQIVFIGSENSINHQGGALLILDGQQLGTDISVIQSISPMGIDHINVSTNPMDIQRYTGLNSVGIVEIFSKRASFSPVLEEKNLINQYNGEYRIPKVFPTDTPNQKRDFRTTLQWIPDLKVDETGQAEISVTAGKVLSDFIIEVQGMAGNGRKGSGKGKFTVIK